MIIYKAENKINGKIYIGQTVTSMEDRIRRHLWSTYRGPFQCALKKYGLNEFDFETVAWCETKNQGDFLERFYIDFFGSKIPIGYNLTDGGDGSLGRKFSKETIERLRIANKGSQNPMFGKASALRGIKGINHPCYGKKRPDTAQRNKKLSGERNPMAKRIGPLNPFFGKGYMNAGPKNPNYGKHWSAEKRKLISERTRESMKRPDVRAKFLIGIQRRANETNP
jgi:group I intron endonuclease